MPQSPHARIILYACSGASDAGELADRIARQLTREGVGEMSCLAGVGGRVKHLVALAKSAERILVIDGCPIQCARKTLKLAGVEHFEHLDLHDLGLRKGSCPVDDTNIARGVEAARRKLVAVESDPDKLPECDENRAALSCGADGDSRFGRGFS